MNTLLFDIVSGSELSNPIITGGFALAAGFIPLLIGVILPRLLGGWNEWRSRLFGGFSLGVLLSSFYDLMKETSGLSGSTLRTGIDVANFLALSFVLIGFYTLHSRFSRELMAPLGLVYLWALLGVGFHSLGEGISIGYDFASGFTILSIPQTLSFALHKVAEGFTIGTLLAISKAKMIHVAPTSLLGGIPVALGALLGLVGLPAGISTVFFAVAVGTTIYLIFRLSIIVGREDPRLLILILLGFTFMYLSGVLHQFE